MTLSPEAWIAIAGVIIAFLTMLGGVISVIATIIFYAGKILGKLDNVIEQFEAHKIEDSKRFDEGNERMNGHSENLSALNERTGLNHIERTHIATGMRVQEA